MEFQPADYALGAFTLAMAVMGLFRGFSGTLAFVLACGGAALAGSLAWTFSDGSGWAGWMRAAAMLVAALLAFGTVRFIVKKLVNGLLAQPSDAFFGFLTGAAIGGLVLVVWATLGFHLECSNLAQEVAKYVR